MKKNFTLLLLSLIAFSSITNAQSYSINWDASFTPAWTAGATTNTATNVGGSGINSTVTFVNTVAGSYLNTTPSVGASGGVAWTLPGATAAAPIVMWADWANTQQKITVTITFTAPVANPTFYVGDIDKSTAATTINTNYIDRITVTGTTPSATTLNAVATKFNAGSTILLASGNSAHADPTANVGGNAPTNAATGAAQDGTALYTITGTVSSITIVYDNFNNAVTGVDPSGQATALGDIAFVKTVPISGIIYLDANGTGVREVGEAGIRPVALYVNVIDVATNTVVGVATVASDGTYTLPNIASNANVSISLSTTQGVLGAAPPATGTINGYANTSPATITGGNTGTAGFTNQNFGLDQLPIPIDGVLAGQLNPGGTAQVNVPSSSFSANDPDGGIITSVRITAFPTNATSITIDGVTYTSATFPSGGVTIPTDAFGHLTRLMSVDPVDGILDVVIPFKATDNAGKESTVTGTVTVSFSSILPLRLLSFSGVLRNGAAALVWFTASEQNVNGYEIEKSVDGISFTTIGKVNATNIFTAQQQYSFTDASINGAVYYRLRMLDKDGRFGYSSTIRLTKNNAAPVGVSSVVNPFADKISFSYTATSRQQVEVSVVDANGRTVRTEKMTVAEGTNALSLKGLQTLSSGNYYLRVVTADGKVFAEKLIK